MPDVFDEPPDVRASKKLAGDIGTGVTKEKRRSLLGISTSLRTKKFISSQPLVEKPAVTYEETVQSKRPSQHKLAKSVDLSSVHLRPPSPPRPASSSGVTTVDTRTTSGNIGVAIDEEDNHPGTLIDLDDSEMNPKGLRRVASEMSLRMSPPRRMFSHQSEVSECSVSTPSVGGSPTKPGCESNSKSKKSKNRFLSQVKDWFTTGEPSAQDWKQLKKQEYRKHGIAINDPEASAKLHAPIGAIPEEAIKPSSGPEPEELAKKRAVNRKQIRRYGSSLRDSSSVSSESSSGSREVNPIAPWA
ncbi:hypothetical protein GCG54_00004660 [Colletotrichum gloeosporioides]|uniref:Uncharacterized protein n=2 Tax=Colletotrichum gloeosporioides TaxID=474922 RepID=A0A8H4CGD3_COLGL|nr:uncharacterized protein GCG54_00004660 [Colletotrichum gloeosporioides]KAF3803490.1 hypothetical protein GCG54_00004660 [Colletotrichum gloeosporioides]